MKTLAIGPIHNPKLAAMAHRKIIQTRPLESNMSSILPATMTVGMADRNPEKKRPTAAPATEGAMPTTTQKILYKAVLMM